MPRGSCWKDKAENGIGMLPRLMSIWKATLEAWNYEEKKIIGLGSVEFIYRRYATQLMAFAYRKYLPATNCNNWRDS